MPVGSLLQGHELIREGDGLGMVEWGYVGIHGGLQGSVGRGADQVGAGTPLEVQPEKGIHLTTGGSFE